MQKRLRKYAILPLAALLLGCWSLNAQEKVNITDPPDSYADNEACLKCHGEQKYKLFNSDTSDFVFRSMVGANFIDRQAFYHPNAVHRTFRCTDCHPEGYGEFPHAVDLRFEYIYECIDCHGDDETYAKFHFEDIVTEYEQSTHANMEEGNFTCWSCHNPHAYFLHARSETPIETVVAYNNNACLACHTSVDRYGMLTAKDPTDIIANHDWLPNQALHFRSVRCIDCHAKEADSVLVAHHLLEKSLAVRKCEDCHSADSHLRNTLYKYMSMQERSKNGFLNAVVLNNSYMIGANRNIILNWASAILFLLVFAGISFHAFKRVLNQKKS